MRCMFLSCAAVCLLLLAPAIQAQTSQATPPHAVATIPVSEIHAGMHGVAYTVFQGVKPEPMPVEVLGILKNANGPKGDIILVRLGGEKAQYTGVVAGMSGSPVYLDGKLAGALAFRIGEFSKEPIAGVTPIAEMLEINAMDKTVSDTAVAKGSPSITPLNKTASPGFGSTGTSAGSLSGSALVEWRRRPEFRQLPEADRHPAGLLRILRRSSPALRSAIRRRRHHPGHGHRLRQ